MSFATATCWGFNFLLALTWPELVAAFSSTGAFCWYAAWNMAAFVFTWFCLPETKERPLEELDAVFNIRTRDHARYYFERFPGLKINAFSSSREDSKMVDVANVVERRASVVSVPTGEQRV
jgi:Na+/melibiose symporter-like transporter